MSKTNVENRRVHERHDTRFEIRGTPDQGGVVARMVARNLSLGGLYCTSSTDFPEMTRLAVRLMLPSEGGGPAAETEPIELEAVVVRRDKSNGSGGGPRYDLALYFTGVNEQAKGQLQRYLDQNI